jgi:hypothetical protein
MMRLRLRSRGPLSEASDSTTARSSYCWESPAVGTAVKRAQRCGATLETGELFAHGWCVLPVVGRAVLASGPCVRCASMLDCAASGLECSAEGSGSLSAGDDS